MSQRGRQNLILAHLESEAYLEVRELAEALGVDVSTIRRDLQSLTRAGKVERLHGGVRLPAGQVRPPRDALAGARAHRAVAEGARRLLRGGESIMIGSGPIAERLASALVELPDLTVITNDLRVVELVRQNALATVRLVGGELRDGASETRGDDTVGSIGRHRADWAFVEVDGVHPFAGLTTGRPWQVAAKRAMLVSARRSCVLAESTSFGAREVGFIAAVDTVDLLVTDEGLADAELPAFAGRVVRASLDQGDGAPATGVVSGAPVRG